MSQLYSHLKKKNPQGVSFTDAVQIFLWIYCTIDILPEPLRLDKIGESELIDVFQKLSSEDFFFGPNKPPDWSSLRKSFLLNEIRIDPDFPERAFRYL